MTNYIAQVDFGALEQAINLRFAGGDLGSIISEALLIIFPVAGLILLLFLVYGGYTFMLSQGDPKAMQKAKATITAAFAGFVIVFIAYWVVQLVGRILGVEAFNAIF